MKKNPQGLKKKKKPPGNTKCGYRIQSQQIELLSYVPNMRTWNLRF